ncbi:MAG TPA: EamA family transporter [Casimicrobiaceae bacterium]|nr:EamA family transporter [Casimicrobiaceae bacterium]
MTRQHLAPRDLALVLAVVAILGFGFVAIKVGLREVPPFALAGLRFFFAAVPMVFFVKRPRIPWTLVAGYGFAIGVAQFGLLFLGVKLGMPAGLSSLVIQVQVFFTIGLAMVFLGDKPRREDLLGAAIATLGVVLLGAHKLMIGDASTTIGFLLVIVAAFCWAVGNIVAKRAAGRYDADMLALVVWSSLVPPLPLALLSFAFEGGASVWTAVASASALTWGCVLLLSWGATLFGFASWARLLHRYPTALITPFGLLIPVFGLASTALLLDEALAPLQWAGVALVMLGLAESVYGARLRTRLRQR